MLVIGHRGAAGHAPENTLVSVEKAITLGVDMVEIDIQTTRDGRLVVFHDKLLDRVTTETGYLWDLDFDDLRSRVRVGGEPVPLLSEVCRLLGGTQVRLMAEVLVPGIVDAVVKTVAESLPEDQYALASFQHDVVREAASAYPGVDTIALFEGAPTDPVRLVREAGARCAGVGFESIRPEQVHALHDASIPVYAWTVNDTREIERATRLGVDGIISDYPDRVPR
ncbi:glycerophosphodiester phosphodiesterase [Amycolatopsis azurea]|uniref:glycerophosphodiester phosphodiesterase n=1 Tax=Amycolatopsis azurea TaxID=36819 RepID=UPI0037F1AA29